MFRIFAFLIDGTKKKEQIQSRLDKALSDGSSSSLEATQACDDVKSAIEANKDACAEMESLAKRHITKKHEKSDKWKHETSFGKHRHA